MINTKINLINKALIVVFAVMFLQSEQAGAAQEKTRIPVTCENCTKDTFFIGKKEACTKKISKFCLIESGAIASNYLIAEMKVLGNIIQELEKSFPATKSNLEKLSKWIADIRASRANDDRVKSFAKDSKPFDDMKALKDMLEAQLPAILHELEKGQPIKKEKAGKK